MFASTVGKVLERSARRTPDRQALTFGERSWSYAELDRAVGRVAAGLLGLGLVPGDRVAAFGKNSDAYLLLYLGCARVGLVHMPVNFNALASEFAYLLTRAPKRSGPARCRWWAASHQREAPLDPRSRVRSDQLRVRPLHRNRTIEASPLRWRAARRGARSKR